MEAEEEGSEGGEGGRKGGGKGSSERVTQCPLSQKLS